MSIIRRTATNLTLDQIQGVIRDAETELDDAGQSGRAELMSVTKGTAGGQDANILTFERSTDSLPLVVLLPVPPGSDDDKVRFFNKLRVQQLELICYADVFVEGNEAEVVACRGSVDQPGPQPPAPPSGAISQKAVDLIMEFEGLDQPSRWPGAASGITIGVGYDLGYMTGDEFSADWSGHLSAGDLAALKTAIGLKGQAARAIAPRFAAIHIDRIAARDVFNTCTLPRYRQQALGAFPGMDRLPLDAQGALISLVFNRGTALKGARRQEMLAIHNRLQQAEAATNSSAVLRFIAEQLRSMKRLWVGQGVDGLLRRRDAEANLVESAIA